MSNDAYSDKAAQDFLEGGATAAKWPRVGYVVEGTITGWSMAQQTDYDSGEALYWDGSNRVKESVLRKQLPPGAKIPNREVMQMLLEIQGEPIGETWEGTAYNRVELPDDDGARIIYVKGSLQNALKLAIKNARGKLEVGAYVRIERQADGPKTNAKYAAPHRHTAVWTPAAQNPKAVTLAMGTDEESPFG
jgi:hypothetical protein